MMQRDMRNEGEVLQDEQWCQYCKKTKPRIFFSPRTGKSSAAKKICLECEQLKLSERHYRIMTQHEMRPWEQQEREEKRQKVWERWVVLRQIYEEREIYEERDRERERWYRQQPDRCCRMCHQVLPASSFDVNTSKSGLTLRTRCKMCHNVMIEHRQLPCCLCQKRTARRNFLSSLKEYALS